MKLLLLAAVAAVASARPDSPPRPYNPPAPSYREEPVAPPRYEYAYAVKDDYSGVDFDQNENRDGYATSGQYRVALPDGRIQTVTYTVSDDQSGLIADVQYQGEARYDPAPAPKYPAPAPPAYPSRPHN